MIEPYYFSAMVLRGKHDQVERDSVKRLWYRFETIQTCFQLPVKPVYIEPLSFSTVTFVVCAAMSVCMIYSENRSQVAFGYAQAKYFVLLILRED